MKNNYRLFQVPAKNRKDFTDFVLAWVYQDKVYDIRIVPSFKNRKEFSLLFSSAEPVNDYEELNTKLEELKVE